MESVQPRTLYLLSSQLLAIGCFLLVIAGLLAGSEAPPRTDRPDPAGEVNGGLPGALPAHAVSRIRTGRPGHEAAVTSIAFAPDGKVLASASFDESLSLWDAASGKELRRISGHPKLSDFGFSPDGRMLATAGWDGTIRLWEAATGRPIRQIWAHAERILALRFSPDGKLVASGTPDGTITFWEVDTGKRIRQWTDDGVPSALAFAPDGRLLASCTHSDNSVRVWDALTNKLIQRLRCPVGSAPCLAFMPDARSLFAADDGGQVLLCEVATAKERLRFDRYRSPISSLAFSPDGQTILTGHEDGVLCRWDSATGKCCGRFPGHRGSVRNLAFACSGELLASSSEDMIIIWDVRSGAATGRVQVTPVPPAELASLWDDLASEDAGDAYRAVLSLAAVPGQSIPLLLRRAQTIGNIQERISRLVKDLDDDHFPVREKASHELEKLGRQAEAALRVALRTRSAEVRHRAKLLLECLPPLDEPGLTGAQARLLRTAEILERIGSPAAKQALETLAESATETALRQEARASLQRLGKRPVSKWTQVRPGS